MIISTFIIVAHCMGMAIAAEKCNLASVPDSVFEAVGTSRSPRFDDKTYMNLYPDASKYMDVPEEISCYANIRLDRLYAGYKTPCKGYYHTGFNHGLVSKTFKTMIIHPDDRIIYVKIRVCDSVKVSSKDDHGRICSVEFRTYANKSLFCGPTDKERPLPKENEFEWSSPDPKRIGLKFFFGCSDAGIDRLGFYYGTSTPVKKCV